MREGVLVAFSRIGLGILPAFYVATDWLSFADYPFRPARAWLGLAVAIGAMALLYRTHRDLGRAWSVTLEVRKEHRLIAHGIYTWLRHPMYAAFWLWALSQALLLPNWIGGLSGLIGFGTVFFARVGREERMMLETFGEEYRAYMGRTWRLIPRVY
jgi:protein-S-isoprenylcysteine O-methyltransferase Ste14